ncbi:MAG: radical SAM family heme chaperone HemW [Verrucomicrobiales bacterium]
MLIYLHIPFCHRVCPYCSFYKHTPGDTPIPRFVDAVLTEARGRLRAARPRTLYLGGGTPSMLSPSHLRRLFHGLHEAIDFSQLEEVTLEANPATFDLRKAQLFRELGVRRVSLGIQSFHAPTLATLGREHSPTEASEAVRVLKEAGMPSVNIDLMFSIPGLNLAAWRDTLNQVIQLRPDHVSAYNLTYEEDTAFFDDLRQGNLDTDPDRDASQFFLADELLTQAGFQHYETSNYAQPGHHSTHNQGYWEGEAYLGLGPSAVSTVDAVRTRNVPDTRRYVDMVETIGHATIDSETLSPEELHIERVALLLRTHKGVPNGELDGTRVQPLIEEGLATIEHDHLVLTRKGSALVDPIAAELV